MPPLPPIHLAAGSAAPLSFFDELGRERLFHGTNAITKGPPFYPVHDSFSPDISMSSEDFVWMEKLGLNVLRLGVMWPGVEPTEGVYDESYLDHISAIVDLASSHNVYTLLVRLRAEEAPERGGSCPVVGSPLQIRAQPPPPPATDEVAHG